MAKWHDEGFDDKLWAVAGAVAFVMACMIGAAALLVAWVS